MGYSQQEVEAMSRDRLDERLCELAESGLHSADERDEFVESIIMAEKIGLDVSTYTRILARVA